MAYSPTYPETDGKPVKVEEVKKVAVIGAGRIGHGIALGLGMAGYDVCINSRSEESLQNGLAEIKAALQRLIDFGLASLEETEPAVPRIVTSTVLAQAVKDADVVIEAVYEDLDVKQRLFKELDQACPERTILASTTSTFMPSKLAPATRRPDRVVVAHYTGPSYLSPLVEIVRSPETSDDTVNAVQGMLIKVGKQPVALQKEVTGFIANRLQAALARESLSIVQKSIASPEDVDTVIKTGHSRRWVVAGFFEMVELISSWDQVLQIGSEIFPDMDAYGDVMDLVKHKVERGELGSKTGKGFYDWTPESAEALRQKMAQAYVEIEKWSRAG